MTRQGNIIGKQLSRLRSDRGLSQAALAGKCQRLGWDLSREVLARIELEIRMVTDRELVVLAAAMNATVSDILIPAVTRDCLKQLRADG